MSLITRCPACETLFKVVPDQLRISEGWVRCGQCEEIFDASLHLLGASHEFSLPTRRDDAVAPSQENAEAADKDPLISAAVDDGAALSVLDPAPDQHDTDAPGMVDLAARARDTPADLAPPVSLQELPDLPAPVDPDSDEREEHDHSKHLSDVSFLRPRASNTDGGKPFVRASLLLLSLVLLLALSVQLVLHERDRIAALLPGLKPSLQALCGPLHCTLSGLRRIEAIAIDSSSFVKVRGDVYRLSFALKNTVPIALATPAVELTLTDSLDRPILRRVFTLTELGAKSDTLAAQAEWRTSVAIAVKATGTVEKVVGYRLLTFYP